MHSEYWVMRKNKLYLEQLGMLIMPRCKEGMLKLCVHSIMDCIFPVLSLMALDMCVNSLC